MWVNAIMAIGLIVLSVSADIMPPNVHRVERQGIIDNLDTLPDGVIAIIKTRGMMLYRSDTVKSGQWFGIRGQTNYGITQTLAFFNGPHQDTTLTFSLSSQAAEWVSDSNPLITEKYYYRIFMDWLERPNLGLVRKISAFSGNLKADTLTFTLPDRTEKQLPSGAGKTPSLSCNLSAISFRLAAAAAADIQVVDVKGRILLQKHFSNVLSGETPFPKLTSGTYFVRFKANGKEVSQKMVIPR